MSSVLDRSGNSSEMAALLDDTHLKIAMLSEDGDVDVEWMLLEKEIHLTERQFEIQQPEIGKHRRQDGVIHAQATTISIDRQAQTGLNEMKDNAGCPSLRGACDGVKRRPFAFAPMEPAKELGQTVTIHRGARVE
jgi:hypothetical protein